MPTSEEFGDRGGTMQRFTSCHLHWDGQHVTVEMLPPAPPPPALNWQEKYEQLRAAVSAAIAAS